MNIEKIFICSLLLSVVFAEAHDYGDQKGWIGECNKATSLQQSPIDIDGRTGKLCDTGDFSFIKFSCTQFDTSDRQTTYQTPNSAVIISKSDQDGKIVKGVGSSPQLHFHSPSEHTLKGKSYELEMHVVFMALEETDWATEIQNVEIPGKDSDQFSTQFTSGTFQKPSFIVIGYLFEVDEAITDTDVLGFVAGKTNLQKILSCTTNRFFYRYRGSLTTPPCTEEVDWNVYREPIKISQTELNAIKAGITVPSNRHTQPLNNRVVRLAGQSCSMINKL